MKPTFEIFVPDGAVLTDPTAVALAAGVEFNRVLAERNDDGVSPVEITGSVPGFPGYTWKFVRGAAS